MVQEENQFSKTRCCSPRGRFDSSFVINGVLAKAINYERGIVNKLCLVVPANLNVMPRKDSGDPAITVQ